MNGLAESLGFGTRRTEDLNKVFNFYGDILVENFRAVFNNNPASALTVVVL